ncbi:hypothetical protein QWY87_01765 [Lutimonas halocynthiae]|uniref:DUF4175 family protein n=1 Tax=Lutimonas halocynthiae TaxID=1446477 RepID=UPI0025B52BD3|nr:DUF4175 family protein [Lutimonas halocynthiae]MDN3641410.1 hypothetical protein [Lutimonas halocynthiae]
MNYYNDIHGKLQNFIKKYYTNEIIKGGIFFLFFGMLYLFITLFIEYFLWLEPLGRTILFWVFIGIESLLLFRFILIPLFKLLGIRKGISDLEASRIIGTHFKEVDDKLLNVIQLKSTGLKNELLEASIEQKSKDLKPIHFRKAIVFKKNVTHLRYLVIPLLIWFIIGITGNNSIFTQSLNRVVHHQTAFAPPAPFYFEVINDKLETVQEASFTLKFRTIGDIVPENIRIVYQGQSQYISPAEDGISTFDFEFPIEDITFFIEGNSVSSKEYILKVIAAPKITNFRMELKFPDYLNKPLDTIGNTGNAIIPVGTQVTWIVDSENTESVDFVMLDEKGDNKNEAMQGSTGRFIISKSVRKNLAYEIRSSNEQLKDFETLRYQLDVVADEYPKIAVQSDMDSVKRGPVQFLGQLTDDYGISRLQVVAKDLSNEKQSIGRIPVDKSDFEEFFYVFPEGIILEEGHNYEVYFEVFDNDAIKGPKRTVSRSFSYKNRTQQEEEFEILKEQKEGIEDMQKTKESSEELEKAMEEFSKKLKNKENVDWNDKKQLEDFLDRQKQYQEMMDKNAEKMKDNLDEMNDEDDPALTEKKEELKKRWDELSDYKEKEELIKELEALAEKLQKEDLLEKIDKLKEQSKQEKRTLERILELTKQFYVEKKSVQIMEKLKELSEEQLDLSTEETNSKDEQQRLNEKFDSIKKDFNDLREQNEQLKNPLDIFESEPDEKLIEMDMKEAEESLEKSENEEDVDGGKSKEKAKDKQRAASERMKELSKKMESGLMEMEMQGLEENIQDLQQILKNLLRFSLDQEDLMLSFESVSSKNADFPEKLKGQIKLKENFEHIDDSLYALSLRMVKLSSKIQEDLSSAHYNLDKSLENIAENRIQQGMSNQQYTMTAANNLADLLSDMLQNLQNQKPGSGKGKGKEGELSLPDIIQKQQGMMKKMKEGMDAQKGQGKNGKEAMSGEQFQMYQEQKILKDELQKMLDKEGGGGQKGKAAISQMEELEKILLEKGITNETLDRMQKLEHELLELENANMKRNKDTKRESETNERDNEFREIQDLKDASKFRNENEALRRKRLELSPEYKKRVKEYFEQDKS